MGEMRLCFLLFCFFLATVSSVRRLKNIDDLKNTGYAGSWPRHGRHLLFWFALELRVDQNIMDLGYVPREGFYGFHEFKNKERILPPNKIYYEVGNLNPNKNFNRALPKYVQSYYANTENPERNMDRLIVSVKNRDDLPCFIHNVFVTAHNRNQNSFNQSDTYEIDLDLIKEIKKTYNHCNIPVDERCNQFLKKTGYLKTSCRNKRSPDSQCDAFDGIKLEITTDTEGKAKLLWNIPPGLLQTDHYVIIELSQNNNEGQKAIVQKHFLINKASGNVNTGVYLNAGLQPRLEVDIIRDFHSTSVSIWNGPEFDGANGVLPIVTRRNGLLQLYVKDGKASARLYVKKTIDKSVWKNALYGSWVGFYTSARDKDNEYYTYEYVLNFEMIDGTTMEDFDIYQHDSSLIIAPGVQIRFFGHNYKRESSSTPWECDIKLAMFPCKEINDLLYFMNADFNLFCDTNNVVPVKLGKYDAGLQLFNRHGKACARLYIKKTFTDWKDDFKDSWVGFYSSSQKENGGYNTFQYSVNFEKTDDVTMGYYIYQYKSSLTIAPGVQIRFLLDKGYNNKLAATKPWMSA